MFVSVIFCFPFKIRLEIAVKPSGYVYAVDYIIEVEFVFGFNVIRFRFFVKREFYAAQQVYTARV